MAYPNKIKVGKTLENPLFRAKTLSKNAGTLGEFKVEWQMQVPDYTLAENILHYKLREYHFEKEFFEIDSERAIEISEIAMIEFFRINAKGEKISDDEIRIKNLKFRMKVLDILIEDCLDEEKEFLEKKINDLAQEMSLIESRNKNSTNKK